MLGTVIESGAVIHAKRVILENAKNGFISKSALEEIRNKSAREKALRLLGYREVISESSLTIKGYLDKNAKPPKPKKRPKPSLYTMNYVREKLTKDGFISNEGLIYKDKNSLSGTVNRLKFYHDWNIESVQQQSKLNKHRKVTVYWLRK